MNDTAPEIEEMLDRMWLERAPQERARAAAAMFIAAREVIIASLPKDLSPNELKRQIFERTYGYPLPDDFHVSEK
jgi:hypothetical protein